MKTGRLAMMIIGGCAAMLAQPASAQNASDVRCILTSNLFMKVSKNDQAKQVAQRAAFFYLGRIERFSPAQLKAALQRENATKLTGAAIGATMNECARGVQESGKKFDDAARAAAPNPPAAAPAK